MKLWAFLIIFLSFWPSLRACDCCKDSLTSAALIEKASVIFRGKATEENNNWMSGGKKYTFVVQESWKEQANKVMYVNTPFENNCGMRFEVGKTYVVFVRKERRKFVTDCCMGSFGVEEEKISEAALGSKMGVKTTNPMSLMIGISVTLIIVLGTFVVFLFSRRAKSPE
ncbi:MAG: hypothetical protein K1X92_04740 [Bacteroidia bacterium]|nr:hypothetical protein [Bacteroidia bacterium]